MGGHDGPLTPDEIIERGLLTAAQWQTLSGLCVSRCSSAARKCTCPWADPRRHKYEFGTDETGAIILADEIHTPTAAAIGWPTVTKQASKRRAAGGFDKDFVEPGWQRDATPTRTRS